jgi:hypothetical protein
MNKWKREWMWVPVVVGVAMGCGTGWDGLWLVMFDDWEATAGDCVDTGGGGDDTGEYRNFDETTGDQFELLEVDTRKGEATVWIPSQNLVLQGEVNGSQLVAEYENVRERGWEEKQGPTYDRSTYASKDKVELNRDGDSISGFLKTVIENLYEEKYRVYSGWRGHDTGDTGDPPELKKTSREYRCLGKQPLEGSRSGN